MYDNDFTKLQLTFILKKPLILHVLQEFYDGIFSSLSSSDDESETVSSKRVKERKYC